MLNMLSLFTLHQINSLLQFSRFSPDKPWQHDSLHLLMWPKACKQTYLGYILHVVTQFTDISGTFLASSSQKKSSILWGNKFHEFWSIHLPSSSSHRSQIFHILKIASLCHTHILFATSTYTLRRLNNLREIALSAVNICDCLRILFMHAYL